MKGYSPVLDLYLRWERGELALIDPATGRRIATFEDERARADAEREGRLEEREARIEEMEVRVTAEAERDALEARVRGVEEENRRLRGG